MVSGVELGDEVLFLVFEDDGLLDEGLVLLLELLDYCLGLDKHVL